MSINQTKKTIVSTGLMCLDSIGRGGAYWLMAGGSALNPLLIMSGDGWDCYPVGRIGSDFAAQHILQETKKHNVHADFIYRDQTVHTPVYLMETMKDGHVFYKQCPACQTPFPKFVPLIDDWIAQTLKTLPTRIDVCLVERLSPFAVELVKHCYERNAVIMFEPNRIEEPDLLDAVLPYIHILKYSAERIPLLAGIETMFHEYSINIEIQTLGDDGLRFRCGDNGWYPLSPVYCESFVDASGAGDWTTAALLEGIFHECSIDSLNHVEQMKHILENAQKQASNNCRFPAPRSQMYKEEDIITINKQEFCNKYCKQ